MGLPPVIDAAWFWERVEIRGVDECWPWRQGKHSAGYGVFGRKKPDRFTAFAHRTAFQLATGTDPAGGVVRHKCDNPPCCNPRHLRLGTSADNAQDAVVRGRHYSPFTAEERERHGFARGGPVGCKPG